MGNFPIIIPHINDSIHYNGAGESDRFPEKKIGKMTKGLPKKGFSQHFSEVLAYERRWRERGAYVGSLVK